MSKLEEKFKQLEIVLFEHDLYPPDLIPSGKMTEYSAKECVEITEQECIEFAEWAANNRWSYNVWGDNKWHNKANSHFRTTSSIDLFQLYQKSKENEI